MEDVELVELPGPGASPGPGDAGVQDTGRQDAVDRRRARLARVLRRWWPVPVVTVVALVGWQLVTDARERDRVERARGVEGVLAEAVVPPLDATPWGDDDTMQVLYGGVPVAGGLLVGSVYLGDGSVAVAGVDRATGAQRWRSEVVPVPEGLPSGMGVSCQQPEPAGSPTVWCTVGEQVTLPDGSVGTRVRAIELDVADGAVRADRELGTAGATAAVGDLVVLASGGPESMRVTAVDRASGATRWEVTLPERSQTGTAPALWASGDHALARGSREVWVLDPADGRVQAHDAGVAVRDDGWLVATDEEGVSRLLDADGGATGVSAPGAPLALLPDDGSAAGLVLLADVGDVPVRAVRALDAATGDVVWERDVDLGSTMNQMLLDGVLYGSGASSVWAVDVATGEPRWSTAAGPSDAWQVQTDARVLLRSEPGPDGSELVGYDLRDGDEAWRTELPAGVGSPWQTHGLLLGQRDPDVVTLH